MNAFKDAVAIVFSMGGEPALQSLVKAFKPVKFTFFILCFSDPIGVEYQNLTWIKLDGFLGPDAFLENAN